MAAQVVLKDLLEVLVRMNGTFILRNVHGSAELRGEDLYLSPYGEWITLYHAEAKSPESRSHLHLKWKTLHSAVVVHQEGETPYLAFYTTREPSGPPLLVWYFPSFYDWGNNKAEIPQNRARYEAFIKTYGTSFLFVEPSNA